MVDVATACPGVMVDLRYATARNVTGARIYEPDARCLVRESVATRLNLAQRWLVTHGARLKIWDAFRPVWAHRLLWIAIQNPEVIGDPARGGSLHSYGACVDVTLADLAGKELRMPSGFDEFTSDALSNYRGPDRLIAKNLDLLQTAMKRAGFIKMRDEWWHFTASDALEFAPSYAPLSKTTAHKRQDPL